MLPNNSRRAAFWPSDHEQVAIVALVHDHRCRYPERGNDFGDSVGMSHDQHPLAAVMPQQVVYELLGGTGRNNVG